MDYYSVLGISKNASDSEIRKAYKAKSMQHHPDRGGDEEKFKEINEAYSALKDPNKKAAYDNPQPQFNFNTSNPFNGGFEDMFGAFGFGHPGRRQQRNQDVIIAYTIDFKDVFTGAPVSIQYKLPSGQVEYLDAAIPPGVNHGSSIRYAGLGDNSIPQLERGNLVLKLRVKQHPKWKRDNNNIHCVEKINIFDLLIGTTVEIITPENRKFSLNVPQGTTPGTTFSISGHGIPDVNTRRPGNVHIKIEAIMPKLTQQELLKLQEIKNGTS